MPQTIGNHFPKMRATTGGIRPLGGIQPLGGIALVGGSRQFGRQIGDRHLHTQHPPNNNPDQVLRQFGVTLNSVQHHATVHLRPNLSLTVLNWRAAAPNVANTPPSFPTSTLAMPTTHLTQSCFTLRRVTQPEKLIEQVETRKERVEQTVTTNTVISMTQPNQEIFQQHQRTPETSLMVVKSLPKVIKQVIAESATIEPVISHPNHKSARAPQTILEAKHESLMPSRAVQAPVSGQPGQPLAAVDINRLTDQVVQALDRRLIAHRERMGRI